MFRQIFETFLPRNQWRSQFVGNDASEIATLMRYVWEHGSRRHIIPLPARSSYMDSVLVATGLSSEFWRWDESVSSKRDVLTPFIWDHLAYAYLVESTRIVEIFRRVIQECRYGERLGSLTPEALNWLRTTEELFFTANHSLGWLAPVDSFVVASPEVMRHNAYHRLLGWDIPSSDPAGGSVASGAGRSDRAPSANRELGSTLEMVLLEIAKGIANARNTSGMRDTDPSQIGYLILRLQQMLLERKSAGKLLREEFWYVSMMSWLHMAIEYPSPIVEALRVDASSAEERLRRIGNMVGLPCHSRAGAMFLLGRNLSTFARAVEIGCFADSTTAQSLYQPPVSDLTGDLIAQYSMATGRDLKARTVSLR